MLGKHNPPILGAVDHNLDLEVLHIKAGLLVKVDVLDEVVLFHQKSLRKNMEFDRVFHLLELVVDVFELGERLDGLALLLYGDALQKLDLLRG